MRAVGDGRHPSRELTDDLVPRTAYLEDSDEIRASRRCLIDLLDGIKSNTIIADPSDAEWFRGQITELIQRVRESRNPVALTSEATNILREYGARVNRAIESQKHRTASVAEDLSGVMGAVITSRPVSKAISVLEREISLAIDTGELRGAHTDRLKQIVAQIRRELLNVRARLTHLMCSVRTRAQQVPMDITPSPQPGNSVKKPASVEHAYQPDSLTGLPGRAQAEAELAMAHELAQECHVALFAVKRLDLINAKFGYLRGDQVLMKVVQYLAETVPNSQGLFRWTPCSFLLIAPAVSHDELRRRVQAISLHRITPMLEWEGHSALVPITLEGHMQSVHDSPTLDSLRETLDTFVL
jgi:GGDEF domain-containing protein